MFFCRGVLETVKKLGWMPDIVHCHGWMTALMPVHALEIVFWMLTMMEFVMSWMAVWVS
jgi:glycogen synthase